MTEKASRGASEQPPKKQPYERPAFRHERMFETMALTCGKHDSTQAQCHLNTKNS